MKRVTITFVVDADDVNSIIEALRKALHALRIGFAVTVED